MKALTTECFFSQGSIKEETKTISAILTEEVKVLRYSWEDGVYDLVLEHSSEAIDFTRKDIMPVLAQHDSEMLPIGKWSNVRLEDGKVKADAIFDEEDELGMKIFSKMKRGFMQSFSVGIVVHNKVLIEENNENGRKTFRATKWELQEASVVTIPAIAGAKIGLSGDGVNHSSYPASAKINENSIKGNSMEKYTKEAFEALEKTHAEALSAEKTELATTKIALETANTALATLKSEGEAVKVELSTLQAKVEEKNTITEETMKMAFARGVDEKTLIAMAQADSLDNAKLALVDNMNSDGAFGAGGDNSGDQPSAKVWGNRFNSKKGN